MKHSISIRVSDHSQPRQIMAFKTISIRERLLNRLMGSKQKLIILIPGKSVDTVSISEICDEKIST